MKDRRKGSRWARRRRRAEADELFSDLRRDFVWPDWAGAAWVPELLLRARQGDPKSVETLRDVCKVKKLMLDGMWVLQ